MPDYGAAISWGDPKPGREKQAQDLFGSVVGLNETAVADGRLSSWDVVLYEPNGAPPTGAMRLFGTREQVHAFLESDEFKESLGKATLFLDNVGVRRFVIGDALMEAFGRFAEQVKSL